MAEQHTAAEIEQEHLRAMGPTLGPQFTELSNMCSLLHWKWTDYVTLFASPARVDLLNDAAGSFFRLIEDELWGAILLHICRLTDDPEVGRRRRQTLSLYRLPSLVDTAIQADVRRLLTVVRQTSDFARDWRDRHIAHTDLQLALNLSPTPLAPASRLNVDSALVAIRNVLNRVATYYGQPVTAYEYTTRLENAESLLYVLRDGVNVKRQRQERLASGTATPEDWQQTPI